MYNYLKCSCVCVLFFVCSCASNPSIEPFRMPSGVEPNCGIELLERLEKQIDTEAGSTSQVWATISNDTRYTVDERNFCLRILFRDYVKVGMDAHEFSFIFKGAKWLDEDGVKQFLNPGVPGVKSVFHKTKTNVLIITPSFSEDIKIPTVVLMCFNKDVDSKLLYRMLKGETESAGSSKIKLIGIQVF